MMEIKTDNSKVIAELQRQNDELVARVARLEQAGNRLLSAACHEDENKQEYGNAFCDLDVACNYETPAQSLQHIEAAGIEKMLNEASEVFSCDNGYIFDTWIADYADKLRQQSTNGSDGDE